MTPDEIKTARKSRKWSQTKLAEKLGTSKQTIHNWEKGTHTPHPNSVKAMKTLFA